MVKRRGSKKKVTVGHFPYALVNYAFISVLVASRLILLNYSCTGNSSKLLHFLLSGLVVMCFVPNVVTGADFL